MKMILGGSKFIFVAGETTTIFRIVVPTGQRWKLAQVRSTSDMFFVLPVTANLYINSEPRVSFLLKLLPMVVVLNEIVEEGTEISATINGPINNIATRSVTLEYEIL